MQQPFSTSALEEALELEGAQEIVRSFLDDSSDLVQIIAQAIKNRDSELLRANSHKLNGCCRAIGAEDTQRISANLESCADAGDWRLAEEVLPILREHYKKIAELAKSYLESE